MTHQSHHTIEMTRKRKPVSTPRKFCQKRGAALRLLRVRAPGGTRTHTPKNLILSQARLPIPPQALKEGHYIRALSAPPRIHSIIHHTASIALVRRLNRLAQKRITLTHILQARWAREAFILTALMNDTTSVARLRYRFHPRTTSRDVKCNTHMLGL